MTDSEQPTDPWDIDLNDHILEEISIPEEELLQLCLETSTDEIYGETFFDWMDIKSEDNRINWMQLSYRDQWSCYILEQIINDNDLEIDLDFKEIFAIIRIIIEQIESKDGFIVTQDKTVQFSRDLYIYLMKFLKVIPGEIQEHEVFIKYQMMYKFKRSKSLYNKFLGLIANAYDYFENISYKLSDYPFNNDSNEGSGGLPVV